MTTEPRWEFNIGAFGPWEFCEQVGDLDIWLNPRTVMSVDKKGNGTEIRYAHAVLKFPRIAEKMVAMRAFLWDH